MFLRSDLLPAARVDADPWWKNAVLYQVYPRSFQDTNGDGIGDLDGIYSRLEYLACLGVDIIWISPIYRSPQADNGYDISDYRDIDPLFGDLAAFDALAARAHELGMRVVMDLVVNHTSIKHPWFVESASGRESARRDWYYWRDPRPGLEPGTPGAEPTNWESFFGGSAWEYDPTSGQYYLHLFAREQPDLNWDNPQVRDAVYDMMNWWLDRGVDGFRVDAIDVISKRPGPPVLPSVSVTSASLMALACTSSSRRCTSARSRSTPARSRSARLLMPPPSLPSCSVIRPGASSTCSSSSSM